MTGILTTVDVVPEVGAGKYDRVEMELSSADAVADAVRHLLPRIGAVAEVTPVNKGHGHECWRVQTSSVRVMVKLALHDSGPKAMANLSEALRLANQHEIPAPNLLWSGVSPASLGQRKMLIQEFLPGVDGEDGLTDLRQEARFSYFRDWGEAVGRMHRIEGPCFSSSISEPNQCRSTWAELVQERLARMVSLNREASVLEDAKLETANERILAGALRVSPNVRPGLIHGDLYPPNTLIHEERFTAMLDFEHAKMWDPIHDFVKLRMWTFEKHDESEAPFLLGYRSAAPTIEDFDERLAVCLGLELLAGFPYWKKRGEDAMLRDYLDRFDRWIEKSHPETVGVPELIRIVEYDPSWPLQFAELSTRIGAALGPLAERIEHIGSTSVEGLPAKSIIDLDLVIPSRALLPTVIRQLREIGYRHEGDLGVQGREAFTSQTNPPHHLYVCTSDSRELARHIEFRNFLRTHPGTADAYAELKRDLAQRFGADRDAYTEGKTDFIERVLSATDAPRASS